MKTVAVSQRVDFHRERNEYRDALDQRLVDFVSVAGGLAVPVPNGLRVETLEAWVAAVRPSAIVLSGGNDVGEYPARDETERRLLDHAKARRVPVLGICRGMQMMGHWGGASLKQVAGHVCTRHNLAGDITGTANSYHNFSLASCPADFIVTARSEDGEIEAMRHTSLPWEGWMWHPEREATFDLRDLKNMKALLGA